MEGRTSVENWGNPESGEFGQDSGDQSVDRFAFGE